MTTDGALELLHGMLLVWAEAAGPALAAALLVGVLVGVLQTATQVNEASVSFVTKLLAVGAAIVVGGPWVLERLVAYTHHSISAISEVVR